MPHRLLIQLARLGDFLQSLPAVASLKSHYPEDRIDLLCAEPMASLGAFFPAVEKVFPWDGEEWGEIAKCWSESGQNALSRASECINNGQSRSYSMAYNLNNHSRAIIAAHLFATKVVGPGCNGPLASVVPNWVNYLKLVGEYRGMNRVHLADAFCGVCGVMPPNVVPTLQLGECDSPFNLSTFGDGNGIRVALVIGSGDADRRIPLHIWEQWINRFFLSCPNGRALLVGGAGERVLADRLLERIPSIYIGRIWDSCGQTSLPQLATILSRCDWVIGSDTGPLHLGVACGAKAQGFYFSRARVHETGPYGRGHWVWQAERQENGESVTAKHLGHGMLENSYEGIRPTYWPVKESIEVLLTEACSNIPEGWSLWNSHHDDWGAHFIQYPVSSIESTGYREHIWKILHNEVQVDWDSVLELLRSPVLSPL